MNKIGLLLVIAAMGMLALPAAAQDVSQGTVLAFDRKANTLVLSDRSVWSLQAFQGDLSAGLKAGDRVEICYQSDEDGISAIDDVSLVMPKAAVEASGDTSHGTVLAHDRKANTLVLTDRTVWALEQLKSPLPAGLKAGDRVEIEYEGDEDGVSSITRINLLP